MDFMFPLGFWLLLLVPVLLGVYLWVLRRRQRFALRYSSVSLVREALGRGPGLRRHIPPLLFLLGLTTLSVAFARPYTTAPLPFNGATVILTLDVSGSMRANDIKPSRIEAAKDAARAFVDKQAPNTRIGIVSFSAGAAVVQAPTTDHGAIDSAIDRLYPQRSTAIGSGILTSLDAIAEALNLDLPSAQVSAVQRPSSLAPLPTPTPLPKGTYAPAVIVLLSDGQNTTGPAPLDAAQVAANRGVRIFTVGVGTTQGTNIGGGGFGFFRAELDELTLRQIAKMTDGKYYFASSAGDLRDVYSALATQTTIKSQQIELTSVVMAGGAGFLLLGGMLSLLWFNRLP